jgi:polyhydroxybutyrate depolymerase
LGALQATAVDLTVTKTAKTSNIGGGNEANALNPFNPGQGTTCPRLTSQTDAGVASWTLTTGSKGNFVAGSPVAFLTLRTTGIDAELNTRLWQVDGDGSQTLISRGTYRLVGTPSLTNQTVPVQLSGTAWRLAPGTTLKLEVTGYDAPTYAPDLIPSETTIDSVRLHLPIADPAAYGWGLTKTASTATPFSSAVARFGDGAGRSPGSYSATISWGDGGTSAGVVTDSGSGFLLATGTHQYAQAGTYAASATLQSLTNGSKVVHTGKVTVTTPGITGAPAVGPSVAAPGGAAGLDYPVTQTVNGISRKYRLFVPTKHIAQPGLFTMLGSGQSGATTETTTGLDVTAGQQGHYVLYPDGVGNSWNAGACCGTAASQGVDDVQFLDSVITWATSTFPVAKNKVAVGGFSDGGMMGFRYACLGHMQVTGVIADGALPMQGDCSTSQPVRVLSINGVKDKTVTWSASQTSSIFSTPQTSAQAAMNAFVTVNGCSTSWTSTTDPQNGNIHQVATGCRTGAAIDEFVVPWLGHAWTATSADWSTSGINVTAQTWTMLNKWWV